MPDTVIAQQSPASSVPSSPSSASSSAPTSRAASVSANLLSWATFAAITYAWLGTTKYDGLPAWIPTLFMTVNALPGGQVGDVLKTVSTALIERLLPGKGGKP